jgi:GT2 family glycosyltransferase
MPRLSIVIVSYNCREDLERCLEALAQHPPSVSHEVVVVDNASHDGTAAAVRARWPQLRVIEVGANLGFARANNIGIAQTSSELVLLLNPDTRVPAGAVDTLVRTLDLRSDVTVAGPRIVDATGRAELSFGAMISPLTELKQKLLVRGNDRRSPVIAAYVDRITRSAREVDWVSGACLLVRRSDAERAGLMDERFFLYAEDVDFCAAVRARGGRVLFVPEAQIVHFRGRSAASAPRATEAAYRRSQLAFYEKHHPAWVPLLRAYLKLRGRQPDISLQGGN